MKKYAVRGFCLAIAFLLGGISTLRADDSAALYSRAVQMAKEGDRDSAFMYYYAVLDTGTQSAQAEQALFAVGEYYYLTGARAEAVKTFSRFVRAYPESNARPFALVYLVVIARSMGNGDQSLVQDLEHHIATLQHISLLFRNQKKLTYISPLMRRHSIVYYIDKVECYADGKLLAQIAY